MKLHLFACEGEIWAAETVEQAHAKLLEHDPGVADYWEIDDWTAMPDDEPLTVRDCGDPDDAPGETKTCGEWANEFGEVSAFIGDWC